MTPCSYNFMTHIAVMNFEMENAGKMVSLLTGVLLSQSATPQYSDVVFPAAFVQAHPIPGKTSCMFLYSIIQSFLLQDIYSSNQFLFHSSFLMYPQVKGKKSNL